MLKIKALLIVLVIVAASLYAHNHQTHVKQVAQKAVSTAKADAAKAAAAELASHCAGNVLANQVVISISKQHMWSCSGATVAYDNPVITGMQMYPADLTPTGTYKIYAKSINRTLAGHDATGSWSDFVNYWMPFLDNQYGTYGFHDLTQAANGSEGRSDSDFGNVDINAPFTAAKHASHGCIEMPLVAMKWLYDWAPVGTTVVVES